MNTDRLREAMHTHAHDAPHSADLLDAVRTRSRQRRRRHVASAATVAAVTLLLAGPTVAWNLTGASGPAQPPAAPGPAATSPTPVPTDVPAPEPSTPTGPVALEQAPDTLLPQFPFTPTWTPPDLEEPRYEHFSYGGADGYMISLEHHVPGTDNAVGMHVDVQPDDLEDELNKLKMTFQDVGPQEETVTVHDREAVLLTIEGVSDEDEDEAPRSVQMAVVSWQHEEDLWVKVHGDTAEQVLRYARGLTEEPFPVETPFTFELAPRGAVVVDDRDRNRTVLGSDNFHVGDEVSGGGLSVELRRGASGTDFGCRVGDETGFRERAQCPEPQEEIDVGGHEAQLVEDGTVVVFLDDGRMLNVTGIGRYTLSREDMIAFAAGVTVTSYAAFPD